MKGQKNTLMINQSEISSYLKDVRKLKVMTIEKERELAKIMLNPDVTKSEKERVKKELVEGNLRFVISVCKQYQNQGLDLSDLIAEGNYGLLKAIDKFDWSKNLRFISYGVWWIKQAIIESLQEQLDYLLILFKNIIRLRNSCMNLTTQHQQNLIIYPTQLTWIQL